MLDKKISIRANIANLKPLKEENVEEKFQNEVLRPVIKLQNTLIIMCFEHFLNKLKLDLQVLDKNKKNELIIGLFNKNRELTIELRGLIIGLFTLDEYSYYLKVRSKINKRISSIILKRVQDYFINI